MIELNLWCLMLGGGGYQGGGGDRRRGIGGGCGAIETEIGRGLIQGNLFILLIL